MSSPNCQSSHILTRKILELVQHAEEEAATTTFLAYLASLASGVEATVCLLDVEGQHFIRHASLGSDGTLSWHEFTDPISLDNLEHPLAYCLRLGKPLVLKAGKFYQFGDFDRAEEGQVAILPIHARGYHAVCFVRYLAMESTDLPAPLAEHWEPWAECYAHLQVFWQRLKQMRQELRQSQQQQSEARENARQTLRKGLQVMQQVLLGNSSVMQHLHSDIMRFAMSGFNVLIRGETGTGKELVVRELHRLSSATTGELVAINCAAIPEGLLESEMFGYVKGAFSGAENTREGLFGAAHKGVLFLDEVGDMPLALQAKLLRVLQEGCYRPLGSTKEYPTRFRLVAATHQPLEQLVEQGRFRQDLYYRLKQGVIHVPPLRERIDDIPVLAKSFLKDVCQEHGWVLPELTGDALKWLQSQTFSGNVRELKYLVRQVALGIQGKSLVIDARHCRESFQETLSPAQNNNANNNGAVGLKSACAAFEADYIRQVLNDTGGKRSLAARKLEIPLRTLAHKCQKYGIG